MQIVVYSTKCVACGLCVNMHPDIFKMKNDHIEVVKEKIPKMLEKEIEELIEQCPAEAIRRK